MQGTPAAATLTRSVLPLYVAKFAVLHYISAVR